MDTPAPDYRTGKICYLEMPARDVAESARFYQRVFGWHVREPGDGAVAFDDTTGQVSGTWMLGLPPAHEPGIIVSIMVANAAAICAAIVASGGEITQPVNPDEHEVYARFRDPAGNVLSIYQQEGLAEKESRDSQ
jgi:hypothetical protein